jgi:hypothetical protein
MDKTGFILCQGVSLRDTGSVRTAFRCDNGRIEGALSAEVILPAARAFIKAAKEPVFFFLELPDETGENYETYYLDNCTKKVAYAVIDRFGELLANDGVSRFGFGSNSADEEIYFEDYQEFSAYIGDMQGFAKSLEELGAEREEKPAALWDLLSDDNVGCLSPVELDGETVFDIPEALADAGMYKVKED